MPPPRLAESPPARTFAAPPPSALRTSPPASPTPSPIPSPLAAARPTESSERQEAPQATGDLWDRLLQAVANRPALSWVQRSVSLHSVSGNVVRLVQRSNLRFLPANQKQTLEELIGSLLGKRVTLEWTAGVGGAAAAADRSGGASGSTGAAAARRADYTASQREAAMNLPMVRQIFEVFGDATLINVRPQAEVDAERQAPPASETAAPGDSADTAPDGDPFMEIEEPESDV